jgi:soluble lytic murein transglycosylase
VVLALAAYNGGESNVDRWVAADRAHGRRLSVADIPFPETRAYVARVLRAEQQYRERYRGQLYG